MSPDNPASIRAFIAIEINPETRQALKSIQAVLRATDAHVAWVAPENLHVSLVFLGDVVTDKILPVGQVLDAAAALTAPFGFDVVGLGTFGRPHSPRVIWAGVDNGEAVKALQSRISEGLQGLDIPLEAREFVPHLTLGRVRSSRGARELVDAIQSEADRAFGHVDVTRLVLMRSVLAATGAQYSVVHEAQLKG